MPLPLLEDRFDEEADERAEAAEEARDGLTLSVKDWFSLCAAIELEDQPYDPAYGRRVVWRVPARPSRAGEGFVPVERAREAMATAVVDRAGWAASSASDASVSRSSAARPVTPARAGVAEPSPGAVAVPGMLLASGRVPRPEEWEDTVPGGLLATALDLWDPTPPRPEDATGPGAALETATGADGDAGLAGVAELCPEFVEVPGAACGPGAGDAAVCVDVMRQARRVAAWAESRVLTAIAALADARPAVAMPAAARARGRWAETAAAYGISEFVVDEVAAALSMSRAAAVHYVIFALAGVSDGLCKRSPVNPGPGGWERSNGDSRDRSFRW